MTTRYDALDGGTLQIMHTDDDPTILLMEANKKLEVLLDDEVRIGEPDCNFGMINTSDKPLKDIRLRQALAYSFSQPDYCADIGKGLLKPITGPFPPRVPTTHPCTTPPTTPPRRKHSWRPGRPTTAGPNRRSSTRRRSTPESLTSASFVQQMYEAAGFGVTVGTVQQSALIDDALSGDYQVFAWRQFASIDPDLNYVFWSSTGGAIDFSRNDDPSIDNALDTARQTTDPAVRSRRLSGPSPTASPSTCPTSGRHATSGASAPCKTVQNWNNPTTPDRQQPRMPDAVGHHLADGDLAGPRLSPQGADSIRPMGLSPVVDGAENYHRRTGAKGV